MLIIFCVPLDLLNRAREGERTGARERGGGRGGGERAENLRYACLAAVTYASLGEPVSK